MREPRLLGTEYILSEYTTFHHVPSHFCLLRFNQCVQADTVLEARADMLPHPASLEHASPGSYTVRELTCTYIPMVFSGIMEMTLLG